MSNNIVTIPAASSENLPASFVFNDNAVRTTVDQSGNPWFVTADVCSALEIKSSRKALTRLNDDQKGILSSDTLGSAQSPHHVTQDRPFNGYRIARTDHAQAVVSDVRNQVQAYEMHRIRSRQRKPKHQASFERQVEALVCDLVHREITNPGDWLAVPFSKQVLGRKDRYRPEVFAETFPDVIKHMASPEMEFLELIKGNYNPFEKNLGRQTVIRAGKRLKDRIQEFKLCLDDFDLDLNQETIVLKKAKEGHWDTGQFEKYDDDERTRAYRDQLRPINEWLQKATIEYIPAFEAAKVIDTRDLVLRRYFNESFDRGGRVFGGFWINMKRKEREGIVIDGMDTVTLDYSQMILRLLYSHAGVNPAFDDGYQIPGLKGCDRDGIKKIFSALLHTTKHQNRMPRGLRGFFPPEVSYAYVVEKIIEYHHPVAQYFCTNVGLDLMFKESTILLKVLTKLVEHGITALPVHDAVIVAEDRQEEATHVMLAVFKEVTGIEGIVSID
jgi:hypothetical protein